MSEHIAGVGSGRHSVLRRYGLSLAEFGAFQQDRLALWLPVALALGVGLYFSLSLEPAVYAGVAMLAGAVAALVLVWHRSLGCIAVFALIAFSLGFAAAQWRAHQAAGPVMAKRLGPVAIEGVVAGAEARGKRLRLVLQNPRIGRLAAGRSPPRIRLTVPPPESVVPRMKIRLRAVVMPPPEAAYPGGFDFVRHAWFQGLGGVGYGVSAPEVLARPATEDLAQALAALRQSLAARIRDALPEPEGAVAAALMTGQRAAIPDKVMTDMREACLAHLLAISGLHIGLLAGVLFFALRAGLALIEPVALRYPIKKWAAAAALAGAFGYLLLTGATVPTQRAFLMTGLVLLAVMLDRQALSMRLVAWAAAAVLLTAPESLLGPSFQMSFGAVVALVAFYEAARGPFAEWRSRGGRGRRILLYLLGVAMTTVIASLATAPFAAYHFGRIANYGLAANLIAVPLMALWIMPWAVAAFALLPFGLEALALAPMGWGIAAVLEVAAEVASWPGAVSLLPALPVSVPALASLGGLWLCLRRGRWRVLGLLPVTLAIGLALSVETPDILVDGRGRTFAVKDMSGRLMVSSSRKSRLSSDWLAANVQSIRRPWPHRGVSDDGRLRCDLLGCLFRAEGHTVALARDRRAVIEDCSVADVMISAVPLGRTCQEPVVKIDFFDLWREGAHALWLEPGGVRVKSVAEERGRRLWSPKRSVRKRKPSNSSASGW